MILEVEGQITEEISKFEEMLNHPLSAVRRSLMRMSEEPGAYETFRYEATEKSAIVTGARFKRLEEWK